MSGANEDDQGNTNQIVKRYTRKHIFIYGVGCFFKKSQVKKFLKYNSIFTIG